MEKEIKIDFIGIGAARSGTSWTAKILMQHPEICFPRTKELNYFSRTRANMTKSEYSLTGIDGYLNKFKHCPISSIKGEFSTYYLPDPDVPEIIKQHFPLAKILVCLRDPLERAFSDYQNIKQTVLKEEDSFEKALLKKNSKSLDSYKERGMYHKQLNPYFKLFPRKNIKVILFDDIKKNPKKLIKDIYKFLKVDANFVPSNLSPEGVVKQTKYTYLRKYINSLRAFYNYLESKKIGRILSFIKRKIKLNEFFEYLNRINTKKFNKPKLDPKLKNKLKKIYASDINKLEKLIKKDLSSWK